GASEEGGVPGPQRTTSTGSVHAFTSSGGTWSLAARIVPAGTPNGSRFGASLSLHGDVFVAGATPKNGVGSAVVFRRAGAAWTFEQKLVPKLGSSINDGFGTGVAAF